MSSTRGLSRLLFAANGLMVVALALCGLAGSFGLALVAFLVFSVLRSVTGPLVNTWINPHIDSSVRATVFSMAAQLNAVGQIAGGPPIGLIGTRVSLRAALVADALLLSPVLYLFARATRRDPVPALPRLDFSQGD
jgi:DHA3 family tetracycline resistance protein-like MFS transporter